jgi:6-pyruvoyltetrahydropterin/6-carboxytetrahydropterin synthase
MKIAKEFRWEMGHRLPFHKGLCNNFHGHSYKMVVEVEGEPAKNGMIIDFYDLGKIIKPIIGKYDHAFLCWEGDKVVREFLVKNKMKHVIANYHSTVENICEDFLYQISAKLKNKKFSNIFKVTIKIQETPNSYAEKEIELR